jgi:hypothetical protein
MENKLGGPPITARRWTIAIALMVAPFLWWMFTYYLHVPNTMIERVFSGILGGGAAYGLVLLYICISCVTGWEAGGD